MINSIKFYYNGIKVNGEKTLVKCFYYLDTQSGTIKISARNGGTLPRDLFPVENDTDLYTDYFDDDRATLAPSHPLYKYARAAWVAAQIRDSRRAIDYATKKSNTAPYAFSRNFYKKEAEQRAARLAELQKEAAHEVGQPTAEDLEAIHRAAQEAENARREAEHEKQLAERERVLNERCNGARYIREICDLFPLSDGAPYVVIEWSEHPAFYNFEDGTLKMSVAAAEIILTKFDKEAAADGENGYYKTAFTVYYTDERGEASTYGGRYDLGDNDGGLIAHIRAYGDYYRERGAYGNGRPTAEDISTGEMITACADILRADMVQYIARNVIAVNM